jgi:hypothetical protein
MNQRRMARIAGAAYLFIHIAGAFSEGFVRGRLVISGDAAATASNIVAHEALYRWGVVAAILTVIGDAVVAVVFYELFKPVGRMTSMFAAALRLAFVAVMVANAMLFYAPLIFIRAGKQDLVGVAHRVYSSGFNIANVVFGIQLVAIGYLIFRSRFLPQWLGAVVATAGVLYFVASLSRLVAIDVIARHAGYPIIAAGLCELTMTLMLLLAPIRQIES